MQHYWKWAHPLSAFHTESFCAWTRPRSLENTGEQNIHQSSQQNLPVTTPATMGLCKHQHLPQLIHIGNPSCWRHTCTQQNPAPSVSTQPCPSTLSQPPWPRVFPCTSRSDCLHLTPARDLSPRCLPRLFGYQQIAPTESPNEVLIPLSHHSAEPGGVPWDRPEKTDARIPSDV